MLSAVENAVSVQMKPKTARVFGQESIHPSIPLSVSRGLAEKLLCISSEIFIAGSLTIHSDASTLSALVFHFLSGSSVIPHSSPSLPFSIVLRRVQS